MSRKKKRMILKKMSRKIRWCNLYIYIKPKLLKLPHFFTSALFKKLKLLKKYKKNKTIKIITLYSVTISTQ